jgi:hypothetical protein
MILLQAQWFESLGAVVQFHFAGSPRDVLPTGVSQCAETTQLWQLKADAANLCSYGHMFRHTAWRHSIVVITGATVQCAYNWTN